MKAKKPTVAKKVPQPPPDMQGQTMRRCLGCGAVIRTKRMNRCRACWRALILATKTEAELAELDAHAREWAYADRYDFTDY